MIAQGPRGAQYEREGPADRRTLGDDLLQLVRVGGRLEQPRQLSERLVGIGCGGQVGEQLLVVRAAHLEPVPGSRLHVGEAEAREAPRLAPPPGHHTAPHSG